MKRAIVLSGGGARGAYQIGFWKAIRKLNIKYDIITGSSVGTINAAMMIQNRYFRSIYLWRKLSFDMIFDNKFEDNIYKSYLDNYLAGTISINKFEELLRKCINVKKIYKSEINYGLVTLKLKGLKPQFLEKKDIPKEKFVDYIIASSTCYPFFPIKKINNEKYLDGGFYDNMPLNLAVKMGAEEIIAVDLNTYGLKKPIAKKNIKVTYIKANNEIGSPYDFNKENAKKAMKIGYNDTMKAFDKLEGNLFTFKKGELEKNYKKYDLIFNNKKLTINQFNKIIEKLGLLLKIDETKIYTCEKFNKELIKSFDNINNVDLKLIDINLKNNQAKLFNNKYMVKYMYEMLKNNKDKKILDNIFRNEYLMALYMTNLKGV